MEVFKKYYWNILTKNYVNFSGRATRKQYWLFVLFNIIVFVVLAFVLSFLGNTGMCCILCATWRCCSLR